MGDVADMMTDGTLDYRTGEYIGKPCGYPRTSIVEERKMSFGKYKNEPVKKIILTHPGYIMWCLANVQRFCLDEYEQKLFDMLAIAIIKSDVETSYPKSELEKYIKDTYSLKVTKETPFTVCKNGDVYIEPEKAKELGVYKFGDKRKKSVPTSLADLSSLCHCRNKIFEDDIMYDRDDIIEDALYQDYFY